MTPEPDLGMAALKMTVALVGGMGLLVAALWLLRRMSGGMPAGGPLVRVIARIPLGLGGQMAVVAVPGALLVVALTRNGVQLLHVVSDPAVLAEVMDRPAPGGPSFPGILAALRRTPANGPMDESPSRKETAGQ